ncbi:MAG TPA: hypothetical protein VGM88_12250 [Kofleriaceae bacterium]|jgi:hypothetical protein
MEETRPGRPTRDWVDAFERAATAELYARCLRYARARVDAFRGAAGVLVPEDLVADAIGDTLNAPETWDPASVPLEIHVIGVIRRKTHDGYQHALRFPLVSLSPTSPEAERRVRAELDAAVGHTEITLDGPEARAAAALRDLRELAAKDPGVLRLLDAYEAGATKRDEIIDLTGFSLKDYKATRQRLARLAAQLSRAHADAEVS